MGKAARADKNFPNVNVSVSPINPDIYYKETNTKAHRYEGKNTLAIIDRSVEKDTKIQPNTDPKKPSTC